MEPRLPGSAALLEMEDDLQVVAHAASGDEALAMARTHQPDVAVLDLQMPGPDGIMVAEALRSELPGCANVLVTSHARPGQDDPQCDLHSDTFHPSVKAWLFLTDVPEDEGPFTYVPGSHRLTPQRLAWEHRRSLAMAEERNRLSRRGSLRIWDGELAAIGLPPPRRLSARPDSAHGRPLVQADPRCCST